MDETKREKIYYGSLDNVTIEYGRYYCVRYGDGLSCRSVGKCARVTKGGFVGCGDAHTFEKKIVSRISGYRNKRRGHVQKQCHHRHRGSTRSSRRTQRRLEGKKKTLASEFAHSPSLWLCCFELHTQPSYARQG